MNINELKREYASLCHAMMTGVAFKMNYELHETEPKHLRTGVNSAMVSHAATVKLLMKKGIITEQEYWEALVEQMQIEVNNYQSWLSEHMGPNVKLM